MPCLAANLTNKFLGNAIGTPISFSGVEPRASRRGSAISGSTSGLRLPFPATECRRDAGGLRTSSGFASGQPNSIRTLHGHSDTSPNLNLWQEVQSEFECSSAQANPVSCLRSTPPLPHRPSGIIVIIPTPVRPCIFELTVCPIR